MEVEMQANAPYYVSFTADPAPSRVDHSNRNPGPSDGKQRAGYTSFVLDAKITVKWEDGPVGADSLTPFFFESVNVFFLLKDFKVQISADYRVGSCPYRVTLEHELESHVRRPTRMFLSFRDAAVRRLNLIPLPTQRSPRRIGRGQGDVTEAALMHPVVLAVNELKSQLRRSLDDDRRLQDSPAAYQAIYARCPADEWGGRGL
jgi:hypothetical protein